MVGTGAGLALGIATILRRDVLPFFIRSKKKFFSDIITDNILIVFLLLAACLLSMGSLGDTILKFAFMSMGLRGAAIFMPLCCAIWFKGAIKSQYTGIAIVMGPLSVLFFELWGKLPFDPLFAGVILSTLVMTAGYFANRKDNSIV